MGTIQNTVYGPGFGNIGNIEKIQGTADAEFAMYDRARSSDAHVVLDVENKIIPIGYFDKFDSKSKTELIYRQPIGSKVPIAEVKPGGWDLSFSNGMIDDRLWSILDTNHKIKFDGNASPRLTVAQRIKFTHNNNISAKQNVVYMFFETVIGNYSLNDPGDGNPLEESCSGYARFRTLIKQ